MNYADLKAKDNESFSKQWKYIIVIALLYCAFAAGFLGVVKLSTYLYLNILP